VTERAAEAKKKYEQLATELEGQRQTLEEMAHMKNSPADAKIKILELEKRPAPPSTTQRVGDLIQTTNLEIGKAELKPQPFDLNLIIDNAMAYTSTQIREKNITLRLDLTSTAPRIQTDRDALQQILIQLLQNATAATQTEGNISLRVHMQDDEDNHFLLIQVTDNGGGIALEEIPFVFDRRYQAEHSLIQGLGDTGVGLFVAKALVEAQNGRIWVETEAGVGSTFNVLIPVVVELPVEK
jgi:two-component system phosphate regulon sensor histidine kinase PhoR